MRLSAGMLAMAFLGGVVICASIVFHFTHLSGHEHNSLQRHPRPGRADRLARPAPGSTVSALTKPHVSHEAMDVLVRRVSDLERTTRLKPGQTLADRMARIDNRVDDLDKTLNQVVTHIKSLESAVMAAAHATNHAEQPEKIETSPAVEAAMDVDGQPVIGNVKLGFGTFKECGVRGWFYPPDTNRTLAKICENKPFSWIRWGDGEMIEAFKGIKPLKAGQAPDHSQALRQAFYKATQLDAIQINVGTWWLCNSKRQWNSAINVKSTIEYKYTNYFYLPMGDPMEDPRTDHGWVTEANRCSKRVIAVVPSHLRALPVWPKGTRFLDSPQGNDIGKVILKITEVQDALKDSERPALVVFAAGISAKIMIVRLTVSNPEHQYLDIGSVLDGYAGVKSRDYNDPKKYCGSITDANVRKQWFAPGVCSF
eukprot:m.183860 g.183860  ORF g.183860 m.183860 type:complete len:425 (-) comp15958_c0_seq1:84-1358(-)